MCNLKCTTCGQANKNKEKTRGKSVRFLELDQLKSIVDQLEKYKPQVYLWGGEPFVYPHIIELIKYLREKELDIFITTNGTLLGNYYEDLVKLKVAQITVSLDGMEETHEKARGVSGIYTTIIENLILIRDYKKQNKSVFPIIDINPVISGVNYKEINAFISFLNRENLCRRIKLIYPMYFTEETSKEFSEYIGEIFGVEGKSWSYWTPEYSDIDFDILQNEINGLFKTYGNVSCLPQNVDISKWFNEPIYRFKEKCRTPWMRLNIEPNGDVIACPDFPETVYGNILYDSIDYIFNNEIINTHRNKIETKCMNFCSRCCYLYVY